MHLMSGFYQSQLRQHITKNIYKKPTFEVEILGKTYQGVVKKQRRLGKEFRWYMVHGVSFGDISAYSADLKILFQQIKRDHGQSRSDILFQLGSTDILDSSETQTLKDESLVDEIIQKRTYQESDLYQRYGLRPSRREHMPNATIIIDTKDEPTKKILSDSGKRYVNKGTRAGLQFIELKTEKERVTYREKRYSMSYDKGFAIMSKEIFLELMRYLKKEKHGTLFAAKKGKEIVSGSVYLFYGRQLIYLYGATDRSYGGIGAQYWLTYEIIKRAHSHNRSSIDLFGVAPVGMESSHHLGGVTRFKQTFGGTTLSYVGNYDLVFNKALYKTFKVMKGK